MSATPRRSLGGRIFLSATLIVAGAIAVAVLLTRLLGQRIAEQAAAAELARSSSVLAAFQEQRLTQLRLIADLFGSDPYLTAYFAEAQASGDALSILDLLEERQRDLGYDFAIALDPAGRVLARTDAPGAAGEDLGDEPLLRAAREAYGAEGFLRQGDGLYQAVAVPLTADRVLVGFLITGFAVSDQAAVELRDITGSEVVYLLSGDAGTGAAASTLEAAQGAVVAQAIAGAGPPGPEEEAGRRLELAIDGQPWLALALPLAGSQGATVVALVPLDREIAPFRRLGWVFALTGLGAAALAGAALFFLSRRALAPLGELAEAAKAAAEGAYDREIRVGGSDEVGEVAGALSSLLAELREKRDMQAYMTQLARSLPGAGAGLELAADPGAPSDALTLGSGAGAAAAAPPPRAEPVAGRLLGDRFELLDVLGRGGMGVVYKARDRQLGDLVALKMLRPEVRGDAAWLERLKDELRLARRVTHPNVLRTFDFGEVDGAPFISMEYVPGLTLRDLLARSGRLPLSAGLHLARQLCRGLEAAHAKGVLHRDIKPENVLIEPSGSAKLMDFGIARPTTRPTGRTEPGSIVGTPDYLSPEQVADQEPDERSDLYAVGLVLYEMFTATLPFSGEGPVGRMATRLHVDPIPPTTRWAEMPAALEQLILRCLARNPRERFQSVSELADALEGLRG